MVLRPSPRAFRNSCASSCAFAASALASSSRRAASRSAATARRAESRSAACCLAAASSSREASRSRWSLASRSEAAETEASRSEMVRERAASVTLAAASSSERAASRSAASLSISSRWSAAARSSDSRWSAASACFAAISFCGGGRGARPSGAHPGSKRGMGADPPLIQRVRLAPVQTPAAAVLDVLNTSGAQRALKISRSCRARLTAWACA